MTSGSNTHVPTFALPPFDNPTVDTILRCRDGVHFRVRRAILSEASPVFSDVLAATSTASGGADASDDSDRARSGSGFYDGKPIITVPEDSDVIDPLLRLCYPITDPVLKDLQDVRPVLAAAMKYQMEEATALLKDALLSFADTQPLRVWAHACLLRLEEEARTAARALVGKELPAAAPEELQQVTAGDFYRLAKFLSCRGPEADRESVKLFEADPADVQPPPAKKRTRRWNESADPLEPFTFRPRPYADIVCRSSDGQDFRAHRIILCLASSTLQDEISTLSSASLQDLPVLQLGVGAKALGAVLELCYAEPSSLAYDRVSSHFVVSMMVAARTLGMRSLLDKLQQAFSYMTASTDEPLVGYLLAARMRFPEAAKPLASRLHHDVFRSYGYVPEMEHTPAHLYHSLLVSRRKNAPKANTNAPAKAKSTTATSASGAKKPKMGGIHHSTDGHGDPHPWVQRLVADFMQKLYSLDRSIDSYNLSPRYDELLRDSLREKVWCRDCESSLRSIVGMEVSWRKVCDALSDNDYKHRVPE